MGEETGGGVRSGFKQGGVGVWHQPLFCPYLLGACPYLLGVATEHGVDQFDAMGQTGGDHITGSVGEEEVCEAGNWESQSTFKRVD